MCTGNIRHLVAHAYIIVVESFIIPTCEFFSCQFVSGVIKYTGRFTGSFIGGYTGFTGSVAGDITGGIAGGFTTCFTGFSD